MKRSASGFTIVELLIVIVVIAILATISLVAYNGIQDRAADSAVQTDLRNIGIQLERYRAEAGVYPTLAQISTSSSIEIKASKGAYDTRPGIYNMLICVLSGTSTQRYAVLAQSKSGKRFSYASNDGLKPYSPVFISQSTNCGDMDISSSDSSYWARWGYNDGASAAWQSWIKG